MTLWFHWLGTKNTQRNGKDGASKFPKLNVSQMNKNFGLKFNQIKFFNCFLNLWGLVRYDET